MSQREVNAIAGRLSLRKPQTDSLQALSRAIEATPLVLKHDRDSAELADVLRVLQGQFTTLKDFERDFPSLCFALATGVGKTRLMGAFISYLYAAHGIKHFFVLAPNLTIYDKLIGDFTPNTPKYVFKGIAEFAAYPPEIITGDNYEERAQALGDLLSPVTINIFNIAKITSEVRGGKAPRIKRLSEYIGQSYFDYLASLPDLVLLMDESHRYRATAGLRAINDLKPVLGLELTATPFVETTKGPVPFKNVVVEYPLARAMDDGFVKEPVKVAEHKDINDDGQTVLITERIIKIHTTATDKNGKKEIEAGKDVTIVDKVTLDGLEVGTKYKLSGWQMLKEENAELLIDGKKVSNDYEFTADSEKMTVEIAFTFDGSSLGGKNLVTFEELYDMTNPDEPKKVTEHKDITDDGQTVTIKEVSEVPDTPKDTDTPDTPSTVTKTSDSPKTGDNTNIYAYLAMLGLSCVGLGGMLYFKRRKKKS